MWDSPSRHGGERRGEAINKSPCGRNHRLGEKEPTNPRDSMFPNHVYSLDILRTQSPTLAQISF
jgi:hypothetical protein